MKKFTKILGFLGFFVTLAITQVGSAWAAGSVRCNAGYYLPAGVTECQECPGTVSINGTNVGVYCPGSGDQEWIPDGETAQGLRYCNDEKACGNTSNWEYTEVGADSTSDCNGGLMNGCSCHSPNDFCPDDVDCRYNKFFTVSGTNFCGNCVIDTEDTNTWCPLTCPKSCDNGTCTCPGGDCTGYEEISGLPGVHYCNTAVDACDVTHLIQYENTSNAQIVEANPSDYQCKEQEGCEVHCDREGCPNNLPSGATCEYRDIPSPNTGHYNEKHECVDNNGDPVLSPGLCQYVVDCGENYHWDGSTCVGNDAKVTYICNNGTGEQGAGPIVQYGVDFYVNKQPNNANGGPVITCTAPNNQTFQGWSLTVGSTSYDGPYGNDYVFQPWDIPLPAGTSVVFTAKWSGTCYSVSFNDTQNG